MSTPFEAQNYDAIVNTECMASPLVVYKGLGYSDWFRESGRCGTTGKGDRLGESCGWHAGRPRKMMVAYC